MGVWLSELREAEGLKSITVRLNEGQYSLLQAQAVARDISVTALAKEMLVARMVLVEDEPRRQEVCVRARLHRAGETCLLCGV